jgi:hypothetical protein
MPDRTVPQVDSTDSARSATEYTFLDVGVVTSAPTTEADGQHHVTVQETPTAPDEPIPVLPTVHGDYYVPPEGAPVVVGKTGRYDGAVVGVAIPPTDTPTLEAGERILSHPLSTAHVRFNADGSIDVTSEGDASVRLRADGTLVLNGGSQGIVTDVQTTTDADGHVTDVTLVREDSIQI